ncbi:MAG: hypothetical protein KKH44_10180 [Bacteroidetes bacterium]|nr:hypothetical protein [Bacteroidota bacterium]
MKFAKFWADLEVKVDKDVFGTDTMSVWGASNQNIEAAVVSANERAERLKDITQHGFDDFAEYEYWNGFLREEVVEEILDSVGSIVAVITRNNYGAMVINSERVFFGDIDVRPPGMIDRLISLFGKPLKDKAYYLISIRAFQNSNPDFAFRVYETFAGLRLVVTNKTLSHDSNEAQQIFRGLDVDPLYARLCHSQACFRARLTPKPWRIAMPRPASRFPRANSEDLNEFSGWLKQYTQASTNYSVVKLIENIGKQRLNDDVARVLDAHDKIALSKNDSLA